MDIVKFNSDYEDYKNGLSSKLDERTVNLMMYSFCMGYCQLSTELNEELGTYIDLNPVFEKISELALKIKKCFE